jgi:phenylalanyl-tRNA synthetase beta chain
MEDGEHVRIANPIAADRVIMRRTLLVSLLETLALNLKYRDRVAVFEIGRVYLPQVGQELPQEPRCLGIALVGPRAPHSWLNQREGTFDFLDLKGVLDTLLDRLHVGDYVFTPAEHPTFHPARAARLTIGGQEVGIVGEVHPAVAERWELSGRRICLAELDLETLLAVAEKGYYYRPISRFPAVAQDIALIVDEEELAERVRELILAAGGELLREATLFDLYRGGSIPPGKKSLAYALTFQADDRTLTDEEVARLQQRIVRRLEQEIGAQLRAQG